MFQHSLFSLVFRTTGWHRVGTVWDVLKEHTHLCTHTGIPEMDMRIF